MASLPSKKQSHRLGQQEGDGQYGNVDTSIHLIQNVERPAAWLGNLTSWICYLVRFDCRKRQRDDKEFEHDRKRRRTEKLELAMEQDCQPASASDSRPLNPTRVFEETSLASSRPPAVPGRPRGPAREKCGSRELRCKPIFDKIIEQISVKGPEFVDIAGFVTQVIISDGGPQAKFCLDLKHGHGAAKWGNADKPDITLTLKDADAEAVANGDLDAMTAISSGIINVSGTRIWAVKFPKILKLARDSMQG